jgi:hypothetical protein
MCWRLILMLWGNWSVRFVKPEHSVFTVLRWLIFLNGGKLYIFHKLDYVGMFFWLCTCFLDNLDEFQSRNKEVLQTTRRWSQTEDLKPSGWIPHRDDQNGYMEHMIWSLDEEVMAFSKCSRVQNWRVWFSRIRSDSMSRFSPYLVRILQFVERAMSIQLYICRSWPIVTSLWPNQSINRSFIFSRVRVNVALLLPWIPFLPLTHLYHR